MKLTKQDAEREQRHKKTAPKQLGNLHERTQYLIATIQGHGDVIPNDTWHAIYDLQTEVAFYEPAKPPYGRRATAPR